ncbi:MAG TPA: MFS transporter, partial [Pseudonocardia sp.]|nr:MFS transporter [Pseudonocardia sp.]
MSVEVEARVPGAVRVTVAAVSTTTVTVLPVFLTGGLAVLIGDELGFDPAGLGLVVALFFGVSAVAALPAGWLVERFGAGPTSRIGMLGSAATMLGVALFARSYVTFVAILLCSAWCNVLGQLAANLTLARGIPAERLGLSFGIKQSAIPIATLLAGLSVPAIGLTAGWRWAYVAGAGLALLALLVAPRGAAGRERGSATPGERATAALAVVGLAAGLAAAA